MPDTAPCEICGMDAETFPRTGDYIHQQCPRCGEFKLEGTGQSTIRGVSPGDKVKLSGWVREQNMLGGTPKLTDKRIRAIAASPLPRFRDRAWLLLRCLITKQTRLDEKFNIADPIFQAITYSKDKKEIYYFFRLLHDEGHVKLVDGAEKILIMPKGIIWHEEFGAERTKSAQGFVAMWFNDSMREAYNKGFEPAIRAAGYDPLRVDRVEHVGKIDDEIIAQIRRSRFVVADFTGHRGGVYFEAGFALGLNLSVIWTCRRNEIAELHFDVRQFNCIDWEDPADLADRLQKRIEAIVGVGPRKSTPN